MDEDNKVISIADFLRKTREDQTEGPEYHEEIFPIFEGTVYSVSAQIQDTDGIISIIDYIPIGTKGPELNLGSLILDGKSEQSRINVELKKQIKRALVPLSVHPEILNGSHVKSYIAKYNEEENLSAYVLEVKKGRGFVRGEGISSIGEILTRTTHTGFRYIKPI